VHADQQRLGQVLLNLLSNAVKYNADKGAISVTGESDGERIRIGVTDTGPGIPEDQIPRLFTPFDRLGAEQTEVEGSGLGLTLSKRLLEAMGGDLRVDTMQGEGTTFWIELAAVEGPPPESPATPARAAEPPRAGGQVLYIEDNLSNLRLIERLVGHRAEIELISAMTGALGLDLAQQHVPDLVLLDLHLPDMRGEDVLIRLRKDPRTRTIPVVILSADATPGQIERLRATGADDYLTKPIDVVAFLALIDRILGPVEETV
jgi:CheY-like chemotaxis protein